MTIAKKIRNEISALPKDYVFGIKDLCCDASTRQAASRALQRMASQGEITKLSNGRYYKPRQTMFGELKPSPAQIAKEFLVKEGRIIGYLTGGNAFSQLSLTTQISSEIQIGTKKYRRPLRRGDFKISFVVQPNDINEESIELLRILDCIRFIKEIPGTTANEACKRIAHIIRELSGKERKTLCEYALLYPPYVRALLGAIMENMGIEPEASEKLWQSLTGVSRYRIPISDTTLPNKAKWNIHEPARK